MNDILFEAQQHACAVKAVIEAMPHMTVEKINRLINDWQTSEEDDAISTHTAVIAYFAARRAMNAHFDRQARLLGAPDASHIVPRWVQTEVLD